MVKYKIKTPHFSFVLRLENRTDKHKLFVGDAKGPCLEATVFLSTADKMYEPHICILHQIDALEECAQQDIENDSASLGLELMYAFINILKTNYTHVTQISLRDASYIPCNRRLKDMLDLLSYDIALYGQTWYEMHAGAFLQSSSKQQRYDREISVYRKPETKTNYPFSNIVKLIAKHNDYAFQKIQPVLKKYEDAYSRANTFSDFFRILKNDVSKHDMCRFFKGWLELFIAEWIRIERDWIIPIDKNTVLEQKGALNTSRKRPMRTRKLRRNY